MAVSDEIKKLLELRDAGALTEEEFKAGKARLLGLSDDSGRSREPLRAPSREPVDAVIGNTVTTQATDKAYKLHQLVGGVILTVGLLFAFFSDSSGFAALAIVVGLVWYIAARAAAWWQNG